MSPPDATLPSASAADLQDRQANHAWRMRMLELTAERGVDLLGEVRDMARERTDGEDFGLAYSRIAKAIRQTVMLHAKLEDDANKTDEQRQAEAAERAASAEAGHRAHQKRQVKRAVKRAMDIDFDAAEARGEQGRDYAELYVELHERLDDYDEYSDFGRLPVSAVVENICRVMGLEFDPALWEDEPWAVTEIAEKPESSTHADWQPRPRKRRTTTRPIRMIRPKMTKTIPTALPRKRTIRRGEVRARRRNGRRLLISEHR